MNTGRTELRLLADTDDGWDSLIPVYIHADQPTLAWSTQDVLNTINPVTTALGGIPAAILANIERAMAWWAWPLLATLLDPDAVLTGPTAVPNADTLGATMTPAKVWHLSTHRLRPSGA